jgi:hypothetical protein
LEADDFPGSHPRPCSCMNEVRVILKLCFSHPQKLPQFL